MFIPTTKAALIEELAKATSYSKAEIKKQYNKVIDNLPEQQAKYFKKRKAIKSLQGWLKKAKVLNKTLVGKASDTLDEFNQQVDKFDKEFNK